MAHIPRITLNNGNTMPQLGLGVWQARGREVVDAVHAALDNDYRLIDTAAAYGNEDSVGEAIRTSSIPRDDIFLTTKVWNSDQGRDATLRAFDKSLERLGLDYVDLYLIHWPVPAMDKYVETWKALEEIYDSGRAKAIGVCNFHITHLDKLLASANVVPAVNQIELHPRLAQLEIRDYCADKGIKVESWSPIGGAGGDLLGDPTIGKIAEKHSRTSAQIILRWHIESGLIVIPKSVNPERIKQNADVFGFELDNDDLAEISGLNTGQRRGPNPETMNTGAKTNLVQIAHKLNLVRFRKSKQ